jgi:hypothetical protein
MNHMRTLLFTTALLLSGALTDALALTTNLAPVADTTLFEQNPNNNLGGMDVVISGTIGLGKRSRGLLKFDIAAALPANATVTSATLNLSVPVARGAGQNYLLHRVMQDWGEGVGLGGGGATGVQGAPANANECTWNARFHPAELWTSPGGQAGSDYIASASASATMGFSVLTLSSPDMVEDVQLWLDSPGTNFGWMLIIANEAPISTASRITSRDGAANAPMLAIEYTASGTPPAATPPTISNPVLEAGAIRFSFNAESNRAYTVEFLDSLTTANWGTLTNIPAQPADTTVHVTNTVAGIERYFRVRTP